MTATNLFQTRPIGADPHAQGRPFRAYTHRDLDRITAIRHLPAEQRFAMKVVSAVLPFRVNEYVIERLIDWSRVPDDPIFQLTFPQIGMLAPEQFERVADLLRRDAGPAELEAVVSGIRHELNPHPAGQRELNVPRLPSGELVTGIQHKYRETLLFFPSQGQTCHAYCSFCFRWAQFIGDKALRMATNEAQGLHAYLRQQRCVTDLLLTGGDPMVMKTRHLEAYLQPLLHRDFEHVQTIRLGTKALSFWPYRFVTDPDADGLLALLERLVAAGKHVAVMAHFNHWRELDTEICQSGRGLPVPGWEGTPPPGTGGAACRGDAGFAFLPATALVFCVGGGDTSIDVVSVARRLGHITKSGKSDLPETVIHNGYVAHDTAMTAAAEGAEVTLTSLFTRDKMTAAEHEVHDALHEGVTVLDGVMPLEVIKNENGRAIGLKVADCEMKVFYEAQYRERWTG